MQTDEDMLETIIPAFTQMEKEGVAFYRLGKPNWTAVNIVDRK